MEFDQLLDKLWGFDAEVFAHDSLFVFTNYRTRESINFHNCPADTLYSWLIQEQPILMGYNCNNYDKHILRAWLAGFSPEEIKEVSDYIMSGENAWNIPMEHIDLPVMWDLFNEINPRKSLKELEGNLRLNITETTIPFDLPTKWTEQQFKEVLYYCEHDVEALFPVFEKLINAYKSKFIIAKLGGIEPDKALAMTNANLSAKFLNAKKGDYTDYYDYKYPSVVDKNKIPKEFIDYIDDMIAHNDKEYKGEPPLLDINGILFQVGVGGGHGFTKDDMIDYDRGDGGDFKCV